MKKIYLSITVMLAFFSLQAQYVDNSSSRWLKRNPTSPQRAERLLEVERQQILETGTYDVTPFAEPTLEEIAPSLQYQQYFYEGQRELYNYNNLSVKKKSDLKAMRARYNALLGMNDPAYQAEATYYIAYLDYLEGDYDRALKGFNALPADSKYSSTVPFYKMQIAFLKGDFAGALNQCSQMENHTYLYSDAQLTEMTRIKAECLLELGSRKEALELFRSYNEKCSSPLATSAYNAAVLELEDQQYVKAAQLASIATQSNDLLLRQYAYMVIGQAKLANEQVPEARLAFEQAAHGADKKVNEAAAYNICAIAHESNQSVWGDEIHILEDFINTYPSSKYTDQVSAYLSEAYTTTKNYEAALISINKINQPNANLLKAKQRLLYQLGILHYVNGEYKPAGNRFSECIQMGNLGGKWRSVAYFWRGESQYHQQNYSQAVTDYKSFISQSPEEYQTGLLSNAYYNLGYALLKQQNYADAIGAFNNATTKAEEKGSASYLDGMVRLADCYYYTRQFASAEEYYHKVAEGGGNQADYALYQEALMLGLQKKYAKKQSVLDKLISGYPQSDFIDDAWLDKGRTALLTSDNDAAVKAFKKVIDNYPDSPIAPQAAIQLAMTYNNMGKTADAQKIYKLVAEKYPDTDAAATAVEDLKTINIQERINSLPTLYNEGKYQQLLDTYQQLVDQNVNFRDRQTMQLLAGKSYMQLGDMTQANHYLSDASQDMRTSAGTEAKFQMAQIAFNAKDLESAQNLASELLQSGTPHQYWMARSILLMSDIFREQNELFTAEAYLNSLKQNYTNETDDIHSMIESRLQAIEEANKALNENNAEIENANDSTAQADAIN